MYKVIKRYYDMGLYSADDVAKFVMVGRLKPEEYKLITGQDYGVI